MRHVVHYMIYYLQHNAIAQEDPSAENEWTQKNIRGAGAVVSSHTFLIPQVRETLAIFAKIEEK